MLIPFEDDFEKFKVAGRSGINMKHDNGDSALCFLRILCFVVSNMIGFRIFRMLVYSEMMGLILNCVVISVRFISVIRSGGLVVVDGYGYSNGRVILCLVVAEVEG